MFRLPVVLKFWIKEELGMNLSLSPTGIELKRVYKALALLGTEIRALGLVLVI